MKIGVLGGSFNPPHLGHLLLALWAYSEGEFSKIVVVPCYRHPFGKELIEYRHRFAMCKKAFGRFKGIIEVSDIEKRLGGISRTLPTLKALQKTGKKDKFVLVVGSDILKEKREWFGIKVIEKNFGMFVIPRGKTPKGLYIPDIKSRDVRKMIGEGLSLDGFVAREVASYIKKNRLYS